MDFYKLDKIDKIVIAIIFILGALSSIFGNIVLADSELPSQKLPNAVHSGQAIVSSDVYNIYYFKLHEGVVYHFFNTASAGDIALLESLDEPAIGDYSYSILTRLGSQSSFDYVPTSDQYVYISFNNRGTTSPIIVTYDNPGYTDAITSLSDNVSGQLIWNSIESAMPFILVCSVFGLGTVFIHRLIKSGSKGKAKLF